MSFSDLHRKAVLAGLLLSLLFHAGLVVVTLNFDQIGFQIPDSGSAIEVQLVDSKFLPVMDTSQETAKEAPKEAKFASSRNLSTEKEQSPSQSLTNVSTGKRMGSSSQPSRTGEASPTKPRKLASFSLSQEEMVAMNDPFLGGNAGSDSLSPGFVEKLEIGEELKLNALGFDYGQYIVRMRERLAKRWNPRRTIEPAMYDYDVIEVQLAIVLNDEGRLVDLKIIKASLFPLFDEEAKQTFRDSGPFPNPPDSLIQDDGRIYMPWSFQFTFSRFGNAQVY